MPRVSAGQKRPSMARRPVRRQAVQTWTTSDIVRSVHSADGRKPAIATGQPYGTSVVPTPRSQLPLPCGTAPLGAASRRNSSSSVRSRSVKNVDR